MENSPWLRLQRPIASWRDVFPPESSFSSLEGQIGLDNQIRPEEAEMRVVRISQVQEETMLTATPVPGWPGGPVTRTRQPLVPADISKNFNCSVVNFGRGATTGFHAHTSDQILIITSGVGLVATEQEEREVTVGDIVHISAGEKHWHGATKDSYMSHITITAADSESVR